MKTPPAGPMHKRPVRGGPVVLYAVKVKDKFVSGDQLLTARQMMLQGVPYLFGESGRAKHAAALARAKGGKLIDADAYRVVVTMQCRALEFIGKHRLVKKRTRWDGHERESKDKGRVCPKCRRNTKHPTFDGCLAQACPKDLGRWL